MTSSSNMAPSFALKAMETTELVDHFLSARGAEAQGQALDALVHSGPFATLNCAVILHLIAERSGPGVVREAMTRLLQMHDADEYRNAAMPVPPTSF